VSSVDVSLGPVPETLLWTLWHRAVEARRPDRVLDDPLAVELVERIEFPFVERFGDGERLSQWQALRARCFDDEIRRFISAHVAGEIDSPESVKAKVIDVAERLDSAWTGV